MTPTEYVSNAINTESSDFPSIATRLAVPKVIRLLHGTVGLVTEIGEIFVAFDKLEMDFVNFKEELGDIVWYLAIIQSAHGVNPTKLGRIARKFAEAEAAAKVPGTNPRTLREVMIEYTTRMLVPATELQDLLKKHIFYGKEIDSAKFDANLAEVLKVIELICIAGGYSLEAIQETNIAKLKARYPQNFSSENAIKRNLDAERKILES